MAGEDADKAQLPLKTARRKGEALSRKRVEIFEPRRCWLVSIANADRELEVGCQLLCANREVASKSTSFAGLTS
jgi:hypothetical protein